MSPWKPRICRRNEDWRKSESFQRKKICHTKMLGTRMQYYVFKKIGEMPSNFRVIILILNAILSLTINQVQRERLLQTWKRSNKQTSHVPFLQEATASRFSLKERGSCEIWKGKQEGKVKEIHRWVANRRFKVTAVQKPTSATSDWNKERKG
jgi:hypothetical protein